MKYTFARQSLTPSLLSRIVLACVANGAIFKKADAKTITMQRTLKQNDFAKIELSTGDKLVLRTALTRVEAVCMPEKLAIVRSMVEREASTLLGTTCHTIAKPVDALKPLGYQLVYVSTSPSTPF